MTTVDFITARFCQVDDRLKSAPKHPHPGRWPSAGVTLARWHALKGVGNRAFYRWLLRPQRARFPHLPERTRLFRLFKPHWHWSYAFLAAVTRVGVADTDGIELLPPLRAGRRAAQWGRNGFSHHRWIGGITLGVRLNRCGWVVGWGWAPAQIHDVHFHPVVQAVEERMLVVADSRFHAATGDPANRKICRRGEGNDRRVGETVLAMLTPLRPLKKVGPRVAEYVQARLAFPMAVFTLLPQGDGLPAEADPFVPRASAEFSL